MPPHCDSLDGPVVVAAIATMPAWAAGVEGVQYGGVEESAKLVDGQGDQRGVGGIGAALRGGGHHDQAWASMVTLTQRRQKVQRAPGARRGQC